MTSLLFIFHYRALTASRIIHAKLVDSIFRSTFRFVVILIQCFAVNLIYRWLDETPTARIIARCTQDIRVVDASVPQAMFWVLNLIVECLVKLGAILLFAPIFIIPGLVVVILGTVLGNWYLKAQLSIKREMRYGHQEYLVFIILISSPSNARSPVLSHFNAAIHGVGESAFQSSSYSANLTSICPSVRSATSFQTGIIQAYRSLHSYCTYILESEPMDRDPHGYSGCSFHFLACLLSSICPVSKRCHHGILLEHGFQLLYIHILLDSYIQ